MLTLKGVFFGPHAKPSQFLPPTQKTKSIDLHIKNKPFSARTKKQVNRVTCTKTKSISIHTRKPNDYRPEHNKINFDPPQETVYFNTHTKPSKFGFPHKT